MSELKVVSLNESNFREAVPTLREIIKEIERGDFGSIGCGALVLMGDTIEVFGFGPDSETPSVATLLYAGFLKLMKPMAEHGL